MQITDEQIAAWKALREHRDGTKLIEGYSGIRPIRLSHLSKAWANKKAPEHVVEAMAAFYAKKISERKDVKKLQQ